MGRFMNWARKTQHSLSAYIPSAATAVLAILFGTVFSVILDSNGGFFGLGNGMRAHLYEMVCLFVIFLLGSLFTALYSSVERSGWKEAVSCFLVPMKLSLGLTLFLLLSLLVWVLSAWGNEGKLEGPLHLVQKDPGGIFAAFMGLVTIVGFALTLHDLRETRRRITSFPDLIERLIDMMSRPGKEKIKFLAYTPALGYIALEDREFQRFYDAVRGTGSKALPQLDMICLNKQDLEGWHNLFIGRRTRRKRYGGPESVTDDSKLKPTTSKYVEPDLAQDATDMGEAIVDDLRRRQYGDGELAVKRLPFEFLPGYYFFVGSDRAIVVAPLQLPFPKGAPPVDGEGTRTVQMLGFETNDREIIHNLADVYDSYKALPGSYIAEHSAVMTADKLIHWCGDCSDKNPVQPDCKVALADVLRQFQIACGASAPDRNSQPEKDLRRDYFEKKLLDKDALTKTEVEVMLRVSFKQKFQAEIGK